jgi:hypothetical protein
MYLKPSIEPVIFRAKVPGQAVLIFKAAIKLLPMMGYRIEGSDPAAGTVRTSAVEMKIEPSQCDCGSSMGMPLVKSGGMKARVYFIMQASNNEIAVKADIQPELDDVMSTLQAAGVSFMCVSKGGLEKMFADRFVENMRTKALQLIFK